MNYSSAIILVGGGGTRLWSISRMKHPKSDVGLWVSLFDELYLESLGNIGGQLY
jgi:dTDP-glucose pyrophosphorylase